MAETKQGYPQSSGYSQGKSGEYRSETSDAAAIGTAVKDKAKELASSAGEMATQAKEKAQQWASTASSKVSDARCSVGDGIESLAGKIRDKSPQGGMLGSAAEGVADTVEAAGSYLRDTEFSEMGHDMSNVIRRYPIQSILVGIGLGFLLARATRS